MSIRRLCVVVLLFATSGESARKRVVFMAGLPGSGKSRVIEALGGDLVLDLDSEIANHPEYDGTSSIYNSSSAYDWADGEIEKKFLAGMRNSTLIVVDGTGTKVSRRLNRVDLAKRFGFATTLLYVKVDLETALRRNAKRKRVVPLRVMQDYAAVIENAQERVRNAVDCYVEFDNTPDVSDRDAQIRLITDNLRCFRRRNLLRGFVKHT